MKSCDQQNYCNYNKNNNTLTPEKDIDLFIIKSQDKREID
jgi:hypothetical protein